jgi:YHS domain-containing protein
MDIDPNSAAGMSEHEGKTYYFCGRGCKMDFDEDPEGVLKAEAEFDHSQPSAHMIMDPGPSKTKPWWKFW